MQYPIGSATASLSVLGLSGPFHHRGLFHHHFEGVHLSARAGIVEHPITLSNCNSILPNVKVVLLFFKSRAMFSINTLKYPSEHAGGVPYDGAARERLHPNSLALVSIYSIAAIAGIAFAAFCLVFNIIFRNKKWVKMNHEGPCLFSTNGSKQSTFVLL